MSILKSKWFMVLMILVVGWLSLSIIKIKLQKNIVNVEMASLNKKISDIERSSGLLEKFIARMNNPAFIEREARIKLNYKSPDENVVFVYPDSGNKASISDEEKLSKMPNYLKWFHYLIDN